MKQAAETMPPAVEVTQLRKVYGSGHTEIIAMRDATLSVAPGEIVAADVAVGYRAQAGRSQWLVYRSLAPPAIRSVLEGKK